MKDGIIRTLAKEPQAVARSHSVSIQYSSYFWLRVL
jgi:hypothetical protein